jgi:hypothetical protein
MRLIIILLTIFDYFCHNYAMSGDFIYGEEPINLMALGK